MSIIDDIWDGAGDALEDLGGEISTWDPTTKKGRQKYIGRHGSSLWSRAWPGDYDEGPSQAQQDAKKRADEIGQELLTNGYNSDEADLYAQDQIEPMDAAYFDAGEASAESYGRRGLSGSGMAQAEQAQMADKRVRAIDDIVLRSQAAAQAKRRSDLQQELQAQVGIQTSDINAQRLAAEQQAQYDAILADAVASLGEVGGGALADYEKKKRDAESAAAAFRNSGMGY